MLSPLTRDFLTQGQVGADGHEPKKDREALIFIRLIAFHKVNSL